MAKTLELSDEQQEYLVGVLNRVLGDLRYEISNTDVSTFKAKLKEQKAQLKGIIDQLTN